MADLEVPGMVQVCVVSSVGAWRAETGRQQHSAYDVACVRVN
jgi:hypothetical protein